MNCKLKVTGMAPQPWTYLRPYCNGVARNEESNQTQRIGCATTTRFIAHRCMAPNCIGIINLGLQQSKTQSLDAVNRIITDVLGALSERARRQNAVEYLANFRYTASRNAPRLGCCDSAPNRTAGIGRGFGFRNSSLDLAATFYAPDSERD
jgi:hypothetical protein